MSGEYDLSTPALTTFTYPRLISNNILDIHGRLIDGKQYLVIGTDKGAQLISNLSGSSYSTTFKYNDDDNITKVWLNEDGDLAYYNATTKKVCIYQDAISSDLYFEQIGTSSYTRYYDQSTTPTLMDNIVNDLVYSANTSTAQTGSNTLYVGTRNGLSVVQEHSTMASGTVKHYVAKVAYDERTGLFVPLSSSFAPSAFDTQTYNSVDSNDSLRQRLNLTSDPHLAGYWDFDQTVPTGVADRSGHGNNGAFGYDTGPSIRCSVPPTGPCRYPGAHR